MEYRKAEALWLGKNAVQFFLGATGIRRADEKVVLYLLDGLAYDPEPLGAVARHEKLELEGGVHFMQLIRTVVVKQILTEQSKQKLLEKYFAGKLQMQKEYEQLQFELKKLEKAKKYQASALKTHFEKELKKRHDKEKLYEFQIEQLHMLPIGSELKEKEVQALVEVNVGDNWDEVTGQRTIIIKNGMIEEIR
jgi:hypothetical protein